jgi:integrase
MQSMAWRKGHANLDKYYFRKINIANREGYGRRGIFTLAEYDALVRYMRTYTSKAECIDEKQRLERLLIKDCVLIASNTMARVGELWQLKWGDVENIEKITDDIGKDRFLVTPNIRAETSKVRKDRRIKTRGGEYFRRLKERAAHSSSDDYVFASIGGKSKISKQKWYLHWKNLMRGIGLDYKSRNITWYSLRHFGITARLRAQVSHTDIAAIAGNGVLNIQNHYGHIDLEMQKRAALKNFKIHKDGISENDQ